MIFEFSCTCVYVCCTHTYIGTLEYNAQSPDEAALVAAAKNFGFVFKVQLTLFFLLQMCIDI